MNTTNVSTIPDAVVTTSHEGIRTILASLRSAWPLEGVTVALITTVAWVGLLGYGLSKLF